MTKLVPILLLALGGASGTLARVGVAAAVTKMHGGPWPWGTFAVNALGCFLFGLLFGWIDRHHPFGPTAALALIGGFCGAFTTFSTFAFDTAQLGRTAGLTHALGNVLLHCVVGVLLMFVGLAVGARLGSAASAGGG